ncbi:hypothetical protein FQN57_002050 [Myotisia sp. PD_48]|nr:hypothetical protein FQN57_002050 [Myotisia sp. PD_48]
MRGVLIFTSPSLSSSQENSAHIQDPFADIYRRRARSLAWYGDDDHQPNHNPFKRFRQRISRSTTSGLEAGHHTFSISESDKAGTQISVGPKSLEEMPGKVVPLASGTDNHPNETTHAAGAVQSPISNTSAVSLIHPASDAISPVSGQSSDKDGDINDNLESSENQNGSAVPPSYTFASQLKAMLLNSWINVLLLAVPAGIVVHNIHIDAVAVFVVNFIAIIPLAAMLSYATEEIALRTGETMGGLLNATFGNAVELIVSIIALFKNQIVIVQTSLIGSMLSNLLLVLGMAFFVGGINRVEQNFNVTVAQTASSLLSLAVASLVIPTAFHAWSNAGGAGIAELSRGTSLMLLLVYGGYILFQLRTHATMYNKPSEKVEKRKSKARKEATTSRVAQEGTSGVVSTSGQNLQANIVAEPEAREEPQLHIFVALFTLAVSTALVAVCAEAMVSSIDAITKRGHISETFVGLILLPIVGNAAEHATAVTVAAKDKMDLSIGVAIGSSLQIALLLLPLLVVIGWIAGKVEMVKSAHPISASGVIVIVLIKHGNVFR